MININFENPWVKRIFSIVLAIGLFLFVNYENQTRFRSNSPSDSASISGSEIITNLPIEVNIDTEHFFVSGIPDSATVRIEGPQAVLFQTVATQNFTVATPDLNARGEGTHQVELQVDGLSSDLTASVSPSRVTLTIEEKRIEQHEIAVEINEELNLAEGYEILEPTLSNNLVSLTGAASTMNKIDKVIVEITSDETKINEDILLLAPILVLDEEGNLLNVNANPSQVEIHAPVVRTQKEVPIVLREGSGKVSGYSYELKLSNTESESITVRGEPDAVSELSNFPITVNFDNITESTLVTIPIESLPEGIEEINKDKVEVLIEVTNNQNNKIQD